MSGPFRVVCVGVVTLDALALVPRYPGPDERVIGEQVMIAGGGPAANAAVVLARQGIKAAFIGRVGKDTAGDHAIQMLEAEGVDVSGVLQDGAVATQASCVVVSKDIQTRAIATLAVPALPPIAAFGARAIELIDGAEWVHTDHFGFASASDYLRGRSPSRQPRLSIDAGHPVAGFTLDGLDLYIPTTEALTRQFGLEHTPEGIEQAARLALAGGAAAVVATSGSQGSIAFWSERFAPGQPAGKVAVAARRDIEIVSTLGAGDVFHGGLLAALCRGGDWASVLLQANTTAALSCRALDARSAIPTLSELNEMLTASPSSAV
ncbi:carbohydrate kinase family protein [Rhodopseudomonas palustris]|uniref:PfkB n=1 Tax=Rhodopseudomonas palustris (strain BisB18) TaxID=316056 RepID=Q21AI0_RHOPB